MQPLNHEFALRIFLSRFKSINFCPNRPKIRLVLQKKIQNFRELGAPLLFYPKTSVSPAAVDLRTARHCKFLATHLKAEFKATKSNCERLTKPKKNLS